MSGFLTADLLQTELRTHTHLKIRAIFRLTTRFRSDATNPVCLITFDLTHRSSVSTVRSLLLCTTCRLFNAFSETNRA